MSSYKITIEKIDRVEYPEVVEIWLDKDQKITESYSEKETRVNQPSGRMLVRIDKAEIYSQEVEDLQIEDVIKAVNQID